MKTLTLVAVLALTSVVTAEPATNFNDAYGVLTEMNIFVRDRQPPKPRNRDRDRRPAVDWTTPEMVEKSVVLRGVAIENDGAHAYVENTHTGQVTRLTPGDSIAGGRISDIAIDAMAYEVKGKPVWVSVGQNLAGAHVTESTVAPSTAPSLTPAKPGAPVALPPGGGSLEERMKARRAQMQKK